jgi:ribonuclease M5
MTPVRIREAVAVEGKYDAARLRSVVDTVIVETGGFSLFHDKEKLRLLRELTAKRGLIVLTDSDSAGFVIRDHISGALPKDGVKHAYIPEIPGKEKRKTAPSAEGLLGVEGMDGAVVLNALLRAGATVEDGESLHSPPPFLTKVRLYEDGLAGKDNSARRREKLLRALGLPHRLSVNRMMEVINAILTQEEYRALLDTL